MKYELRPYQVEGRDAILHEWDAGHSKTLLVLPTGCHALGQKLLMSTGESRAVEDIHVGDRLMGPDGTSRTVLYRTEGEAPLYSIHPVKGEMFFVTGDHKLTLVRTNQDKNPVIPSHKRGGELLDVSIKEWLGWNKTRKHLYKLVRCSGIKEFEGRTTKGITVDPYFLGILLGDGELNHGINVTTAEPEVVAVIKEQAEKYQCSLRSVPAGKADTWFLTHCKAEITLKDQLQALGVMNHTAGGKFVPDAYKYAPIKERLEILAGLIDSDGFLTGNGYDYITKSSQLADDITFICRSVGLAAYINWCFKTWNGKVGDYFRISISGDCSIIPCRVERRKASKRRQIKDVLRTGFSVEKIETGPYVGFTVDKDNRYLMDDFTITHNCGKTITFASVIDERLKENSGRALILAHREELLTQAADKMQEAFGIESSLEKAESTSLGGMFPVTVGSVQTMSREKRLAKFPPDYFKTIIVDEAHHSLSDSYQRLLLHFPDAKVLGVTATPDRGDKQQLGKYFDSLAYEYSLSQAIKDGYLVPIKAQMISLDINLQNVGISQGDYAAGDIGYALEPYLEKIADEMVHYCEDRKTVVFLPLISTSQKFCQMLKDRGMRAAEVNGQSDDRAEILADFADGKYDVLCNSMLLTEGWDCPSVDCIVVLRPTRVRGLYQQMVGRGTRLYPGKKDLLLLDFLWLTDRHDLCRPSALIAKDQETAERIDQKVKEDPDGVDIMEVEEAAEKDAVAEREASLARQLAEMRKQKNKLVDPIQYAMSIEADDLAGYEPTFAWEMGPASEKQLEFLEHRGIYPAAVKNAGYASVLIDRLKRRQDEGLSTPKQIRCLERYGFRHVGTWLFEDASRMISAIAGNRWQLPRGLEPSLYTP